MNRSWWSCYDSRLHWLRLGKTRIALKLIDAFVRRDENTSVLVVVPTRILKDQWIDQLEEWGLLQNARVEIINSVIKLNWTCNLLVIDKHFVDVKFV